MTNKVLYNLVPVTLLQYSLYISESFVTVFTLNVTFYSTFCWIHNDVKQISSLMDIVITVTMCTNVLRLKYQTEFYQGCRSEQFLKKNFWIWLKYLILVPFKKKNIWNLVSSFVWNLLLHYPLVIQKVYCIIKNPNTDLQPTGFFCLICRQNMLNILYKNTAKLSMAVLC